MNAISVLRFMLLVSGFLMVAALADDSGLESYDMLPTWKPAGLLPVDREIHHFFKEELDKGACSESQSKFAGFLSDSGAPEVATRIGVERLVAQAAYPMVKNRALAHFWIRNFYHLDGVEKAAEAVFHFLPEPALRARLVTDLLEVQHHHPRASRRHPNSQIQQATTLLLTSPTAEIRWGARLFAAEQMLKQGRLEHANVEFTSLGKENVPELVSDLILLARASILFELGNRLELNVLLAQLSERGKQFFEDRVLLLDGWFDLLEGKTDAARLSFEILLCRYPESVSAESARQLLGSLKEAHSEPNALSHDEIRLSIIGSHNSLERRRFSKVEKRVIHLLNDQAFLATKHKSAMDTRQLIDCKLLLARCAFQTYQFDTAQKRLSRLLDEMPVDDQKLTIQIRALLANTEFFRGRYFVARNMFELVAQAEAAPPDAQADALMGIGDCLAAQAKWSLARQVYLEALRKYPQVSPRILISTRRMIAQSYLGEDIAMGFDNAIKDLQEKHPDARAEIIYTRILFSLKKIQFHRMLTELKDFAPDILLSSKPWFLASLNVINQQVPEMPLELRSAYRKVLQDLASSIPLDPENIPIISRIRQEEIRLAILYPGTTREE